ncbi:MAG TPA: Ig-like domain-containing protein [Vicinamibacterales bacterium]|nr:Ig-like domain-containing protein [Vicinamibacterales bacterium]
MRARIAFIVAVSSLVMSAACSTPTLPSTTITSLSIIGSPPGVGATSQYTANVVPATSSTVENVTSLVTWQIDDTTVATISKTGVVTGIKVGTTTLTATYNGTTVSQQLAIP